MGSSNRDSHLGFITIGSLFLLIAYKRLRVVSIVLLFGNEPIDQ